MTAQQAPTTPPPVPTGPPAHRRRWLGVAAVAWATVLLALTYLSVGRDAPTVREQRSIAEAMPMVHRALGAVIAAAGRHPVVALGPVTIEEGCRITPFRDGATLEQTVSFHTSQAGAAALLDQIAQAMPPGYRASTRQGRGGETRVLRADAGEFVRVEGVTEPGLVRVTATTGCRPMSPPAAGAGHLAGQRSIDEEPLRVLATLGASAVRSGANASVACPAGGAVYTARAVGRVGREAALRAALRAGAVVVVDQPDVYAYHRGKLDVAVITTGDGEVRVTVTSVC